jgi:hypothetical protein
MNRDDLIQMMVKLLQASLEEHGAGETLKAAPDSPLVGAEAVVSSMALVAFITDVESTVAQDFGFETTLVNEKALSRKNSPFRSIEALADYVLELAAEAGRSEPVGKEINA